MSALWSSGNSGERLAPFAAWRSAVRSAIRRLRNRRLATAKEDPELAASLDEAHAAQRDLRPELDVGIGGSSRSGSLKCLHAHAAFALARPGYELGDRILAEVPALWPVDRCCSE